jgi:hypothetical protein
MEELDGAETENLGQLIGMVNDPGAINDIQIIRISGLTRTFEVLIWKGMPSETQAFLRRWRLLVRYLGSFFEDF